MCWPVDRPATHAAAGAAARGVRGDWGILLRLDWEPLRGRGLDHGSGQTRMPPQSDGTRGFCFGGFFCGWTEELLREGRLKVARGRSWQPEIGMEHASRGRRSGNKGVGARWRGRFRIFSARHRSRTKVSHAENSGMRCCFFLWRLLRCRRGILSQARERQHEGGGVGGIILRFCGGRCRRLF